MVRRRDAARMLEFVEQALDEIVLGPNFEIDGPLYLSITLCWDVGPGSVFGHEVEDGASVRAATCDGVTPRPQAGDQFGHRSLVGSLAQARHQFDCRPRRLIAARSSMLVPPRERPLA